MSAPDRLARYGTGGMAPAPRRPGAPPGGPTGAGRPCAADALAAVTPLEALRRLGSGPRGLSEAEAERRLARYGENVPPARRPLSWPRRLVRSLRDPFTTVLLCLGLVSAAVASWGTACVIAVLVLVSAVVRASGEHRADRSTAALRELVATTATVRRRPTDHGEPLTREVPAEHLVPGDVIRLGPGDSVPADVRLLRSSGLTVHQAPLTGESAPVAKHPVEVPGPPYGAEWPQVCYQGSSVATGSGTAVVLATGGDTRFAGAWGGPVREGRSAFDRAVNGVSWILIRFTLLTPPLVLMANAALAGRGLRTLPFAVAVAVGLTPEILPVVVTTSLARGAAALARERELIVKRLPALHDIGAVTVLCTDKTGTLTQDRPVLHDALDPYGRPAPDALRWAAVNSWWTLQLAEPPTPDSLDEAILAAVRARGEPVPEYHGVAAEPFDPVARCSSATVLGPGRAGARTMVVKGATETVLARCVRLRVEGRDVELDAAARDRLDAVAAERAADGLRLLAVAVAEHPPRADRRTDSHPLGAVPSTGGATTPASIRTAAAAPARTEPTGVRNEDTASAGARATAAGAEAEARVGARVGAGSGAVGPADGPAAEGLTLVGFVALRDALAPTATSALDVLARRGVTVKVLTGDHPGTAARACRDLGLDPGPVVTGDQLDGLAEPALAELARRTTVFARCAPEHKARVIGALRGAGHTTGFLGDGVNDLSALHAADVGVCPRDGAEVAREAADVVLASKDLTAIDRAIVAGRRATGSITTYLHVTLSSNLGNVIAMLAAGLLLPFLPMLPSQVLVQNLCFDGAQLAYAFDRPGPAVLRRPTVLRPAGLLRFISCFGALNAAADLAIFAVLALAVPVSGRPGGEAAFHAGWFAENLLTQALVMLLLRGGHRHRGARPARPERGRQERGRPERGRSERAAVRRIRGLPLALARGLRRRRGAGPVRPAAAALGAVGLLLPVSPLGPVLGMTVLPGTYYLSLAAVLALYGAGLAAARARWERGERGGA